MPRSSSAPKAKRTHKPPAQREAEILAIAARVFASQGYRSVDVQQIADRAGVGKGTVYRYFPTKEGLFLAALEHRLERLLERVETAAACCDDPLDKIMAAIRAYIAYFQDHPETVELFIQERAEFRDRATPLYFVYRARHRQQWLDLFAQLAAAGRMHADETAVAFEMLGCLLYGYVLSRNTGGDAASSEPFERMFTLFLRGALTH